MLDRADVLAELPATTALLGPDRPGSSVHLELLDLLFEVVFGLLELVLD